MIHKHIALVVICFLMMAPSIYAQNQPPIVTDVSAEQILGTQIVDISYTLSDSDSDSLFVAVQVSENNGTTYNLPAWSFTGDVGYGVTTGIKSITWDAGADYPEQYGTEYKVKIIASDAPIGKFVLIPTDTANIGNDQSLVEFQPAHDVLTSAYYAGVTEITNIQYKLFADATGRSYPSDPVADYFVNHPDYPVVNVSWHDAAEYCNWLSERFGYTPCYNTTDWSCTYSNDGFRLPTEAEWERAARGRLEGASYPWGEDFIADRANYSGYTGDLDNLKIEFATGRGPMPVASFDSTGFGLFDMAGNVAEWCNDWYNRDYYAVSPFLNPTGPGTGYDKVKRGGDWNNSSEYLRCFHRTPKEPASLVRGNEVGFRIVRRK